YRIGVYGPRNVCTRVCEAGYAEFSFVSDMSSGFSGNMGYPIPDGWSIDQISNVTITHGNDSLEIDNDLVS
ncbi:glycoside hydrolase domain-containing protein, partial [Pseudoscardovia radai]